MNSLRSTSKIKKIVQEFSFWHEIRQKYRKLKIKRRLTWKQRREIQSFFKEAIGRRVPLIWHKFLYSRTGVYSPYYIPVGVYRTEMIGRLNNFMFKDAYADKNVADELFPDINQPKTFVKNINHHYYAEGMPITDEKALELCQNLGDVIIKPSLLTRGQGVRRVTIAQGRVEGSQQTLAQLFAEYDRDFIVQSVVKQHERMAALNPASANTIRLLTYRHDMEVRLLYAVIRIGRAGQVIDNESAGGISTYIDANGRLGKYAYGAPGYDHIEKTDSGITLEGYQIPSFDAVVETVKALHMRLPYFNIAAWDFAVGENGEPVFIEWNADPDLSQSAFGPAFGERPIALLKEIYQSRNTRHSYW
jgi:hypothetical protein